jgi:hypothetical protein
LAGVFVFRQARVREFGLGWSIYISPGSGSGFSLQHKLEPVYISVCDEMLSGKSKSGNPCLAWFLGEISIRDSKRSLGKRFGHLMKSLTFRNTQKGLGLDSSSFSLLFSSRLAELLSVYYFAWQGVGRAPRLAEPSPSYFLKLPKYYMK